MSKKSKPKYKTLKISRIRKAASEIYSTLEQQHNVHGVVEFDITETRKKFAQIYEKTNLKLSFSAFIINCIAKAVSDNKRVQALKQGRNKLIVFEDVDVTTIVERIIEEESWPVPYVIREVNNRSLVDIHKEIRKAQKDENVTKNIMDLVNFYLRFPRFMRIMARKWIIRRPKLVKQYAGTILVTSVGITAVNGGWGIPYVGHPLVVTIGGIERKPKAIKDKVEIRECINLTLTFDHDLIDGAPAARFVAQLQKLLDEGYGLEELLKLEKPIK